MVKLLIIADDLTGANDTGVQFSKRGIPVFIVPFTSDESPALHNDYPVLVVNTESRHLSADEAALVVRKIVWQGTESGVTHFYKKTDSSMRGNIGSELEALMLGFGQRILPFMPAYPKLKRTTRDGFQYLEDKLLHETAFAQDPLEPISDCYVPAIINQQTRIRSWVVKPHELSLNDRHRFDEDGIYVFDAANEDELQQIGEVLKRNDLLKATAGSAGFAAYLPDLLGFEQSSIQLHSARGQMLVVSGSVNEASLNQVSHAEDYGGYAAVTLSPEILVTKQGAQSAQARQAIAGIIELAQQQRNVILRSIKTAQDLKIYLEHGQACGLDPKQIHFLIAQNLGEIISRVLEKTNFRLLTIFGGDTLVAIGRALGWRGILPQYEVLPGVVVSKVVDCKNDLLLITKAGGFGSEDVLLRVKDILGGEN